MLITVNVSSHYKTSLKTAEILVVGLIQACEKENRFRGVLHFRHAYTCLSGCFIVRDGTTSKILAVLEFAKHTSFHDIYSECKAACCVLHAKDGVLLICQKSH